MGQLEKRAWAAIQKISSSHPPRSEVAAVSHNLALCTIICKVLDLGLNHFRKVRLSTAGVSQVEFTPFGPVLGACRLNAFS